MTSRDVWKSGSGRLLQELLSSALLTLLLPGPAGLTVYFASPWISDFRLFENGARQVAALFPDLADQDQIQFVEYLGALGERHNVRIITAQNRTSDAFVERLRANMRQRVSGSIKARISPQETHEKGILAPGFYIDGSMNITHSGVHVNGEKIAYHSAGGDGGAARVAAAYLEFDRRWGLLSNQEVGL
jgi:hypothetical protein